MELERGQVEERGSWPSRFGSSYDCEGELTRLWPSASLYHLKNQHLGLEAWLATASRLDFSLPDLDLLSLLLIWLFS